MTAAAAGGVPRSGRRTSDEGVSERLRGRGETALQTGMRERDARAGSTWPAGQGRHQWLGEQRGTRPAGRPTPVQQPIEPGIRRRNDSGPPPGDSVRGGIEGGSATDPGRPAAGPEPADVEQPQFPDRMQPFRYGASCSRGSETD